MPGMLDSSAFGCRVMPNQTTSHDPVWPPSRWSPGSHSWNNFQDWGAFDPPPEFDYSEYLDFLEAHGHNFIRLYVWEQAAWLPWEKGQITISPLPYVRSGPGVALDGTPRLDQL
jgi:hypothetical protein